MNIRWTAQARDDLRSIRQWAGRSSPQNADGVVRRLRARTRSLVEHPFIGRMVPEYQLERFRELIEPPYRIMYQVFADRVEIVTIRHGAEDLPEWPAS